MRQLLFELQAPQIIDGRHHWVVLGELWIRVRPMRGSLALLASREAGEMIHSVRLRHSDLVKPGRRFVKEGRVLNIENVRDIGDRRRWLSCQCRETVPVALHGNNEGDDL